jgi:hypothetical protein
MKNIKLFLFTYILGATLLVSCTKSIDSAPAPANANKEAMSCLIDGQVFTAKANAVVQPAFINISATQKDGVALDMYIAGRNVGYYEIGGGAASTAAIGPNNGTNQSSGHVVITSIDNNNKTVSGTFNFTVIRNNDNTRKTVTNGTFTDVSF